MRSCFFAVSMAEWRPFRGEAFRLSSAGAVSCAASASSEVCVDDASNEVCVEDASSQDSVEVAADDKDDEALRGTESIISQQCWCLS